MSGWFGIQQLGASPWSGLDNPIGYLLGQVAAVGHAIQDFKVTYECDWKEAKLADPDVGKPLTSGFGIDWASYEQAFVSWEATHPDKSARIQGESDFTGAIPPVPLLAARTPLVVLQIDRGSCRRSNKTCLDNAEARTAAARGEHYACIYCREEQRDVYIGLRGLREQMEGRPGGGCLRVIGFHPVARTPVVTFTPSYRPRSTGEALRDKVDEIFYNLQHKWVAKNIPKVGKYLGKIPLVGEAGLIDLVSLATAPIPFLGLVMEATDLALAGAQVGAAVYAKVKAADQARRRNPTYGTLITVSDEWSNHHWVMARGTMESYAQLARLESFGIVLNVDEGSGEVETINYYYDAARDWYTAWNRTSALYENYLNFWLGNDAYVAVLDARSEVSDGQGEDTDRLDRHWLRKTAVPLPAPARRGVAWAAPTASWYVSERAGGPTYAKSVVEMNVNMYMVPSPDRRMYIVDEDTGYPADGIWAVAPPTLPVITEAGRPRTGGKAVVYFARAAVRARSNGLARTIWYPEDTRDLGWAPLVAEAMLQEEGVVYVAALVAEDRRVCVPFVLSPANDYYVACDMDFEGLDARYLETLVNKAMGKTHASTRAIVNDAGEIVDYALFWGPKLWGLTQRETCQAFATLMNLGGPKQRVQLLDGDPAGPSGRVVDLEPWDLNFAFIHMGAFELEDATGAWHAYNCVDTAHAARPNAGTNVAALAADVLPSFARAYFKAREPAGLVYENLVNRDWGLTRDPHRRLVWTASTAPGLYIRTVLEGGVYVPETPWDRERMDRACDAGLENSGWVPAHTAVEVKYPLLRGRCTTSGVEQAPAEHADATAADPWEKQVVFDPARGMYLGVNDATRLNEVRANAHFAAARAAPELARARTFYADGLRDLRPETGRVFVRLFVAADGASFTWASDLDARLYTELACARGLNTLRAVEGAPPEEAWLLEALNEGAYCALAEPESAVVAEMGYVAPAELPLEPGVNRKAWLQTAAILKGELRASLCLPYSRPDSTLARTLAGRLFTYDAERCVYLAPSPEAAAQEKAINDRNNFYTPDPLRYGLYKGWGPKARMGEVLYNRAKSKELAATYNLYYLYCPELGHTAPESNYARAVFVGLYRDPATGGVGFVDERDRRFYLQYSAGTEDLRWRWVPTHGSSAELGRYLTSRAPALDEGQQRVIWDMGYDKVDDLPWAAIWGSSSGGEDTPAARLAKVGEFAALPAASRAGVLRPYSTAASTITAEHQEAIRAATEGTDFEYKPEYGMLVGRTDEARLQENVVNGQHAHGLRAARTLVVRDASSGALAGFVRGLLAADGAFTFLTASDEALYRDLVCAQAHDIQLAPGASETWVLEALRDRCLTEPERGVLAMLGLRSLAQLTGPANALAFLKRLLPKATATPAAFYTEAATHAAKGSDVDSTWVDPATGAVHRLTYDASDNLYRAVEAGDERVVARANFDKTDRCLPPQTPNEAPLPCYKAAHGEQWAAAEAFVRELGHKTLEDFMGANEALSYIEPLEQWDLANPVVYRSLLATFADGRGYAGRCGQDAGSMGRAVCLGEADARAKVLGYEDSAAFAVAQSTNYALGFRQLFGAPLTELVAGGANGAPHALCRPDASGAICNVVAAARKAAKSGAAAEAQALMARARAELAALTDLEIQE